jgi:hypothetical protein
MSLQQWAQSDQEPHVKVNDNFTTLEALRVYGQRPEAHSGLTWAYHGGPWGASEVADGTLTLVASATNYIVVNRATAVISVSSTSTNWDNTASYARVYQVTTGAAAVTAVADHRTRTAGVFATGAAAPGGGNVVDHLVLTVKTVANEAIPLVTNIAIAGTIKRVTTVCASGTATAEVTINGAGIGSANAVSATEQAQTQADAFVVGDNIGVTFTANAGCTMANVTIEYERAA